MDSVNQPSSHQPFLNCRSLDYRREKAAQIYFGRISYGKNYKIIYLFLNDEFLFFSAPCTDIAKHLLNFCHLIILFSKILAEKIPNNFEIRFPLWCAGECVVKKYCPVRSTFSSWIARKTSRTSWSSPSRSSARSTRRAAAPSCSSRLGACPLVAITPLSVSLSLSLHPLV